MHTGVTITIQGKRGSGKTTIATIIRDALLAHGQTVNYYNQPENSFPNIWMDQRILEVPAPEFGTLEPRIIRIVHVSAE